ncbi:hypothetical protein HDU96_007448 [Phlyctochytrium bullatum]|nr:hypothetical protein HDU96_007448 [Phlyctochytrium bullatum]
MVIRKVVSHERVVPKSPPTARAATAANAGPSSAAALRAANSSAAAKSDKDTPVEGVATVVDELTIEASKVEQTDKNQPAATTIAADPPVKPPPLRPPTPGDTNEAVSTSTVVPPPVPSPPAGAAPSPATTEPLSPSSPPNAIVVASATSGTPTSPATSPASTTATSTDSPLPVPAGTAHPLATLLINVATQLASETRGLVTRFTHTVRVVRDAANHAGSPAAARRASLHAGSGIDDEERAQLRLASQMARQRTDVGGRTLAEQWEAVAMLCGTVEGLLGQVAVGAPVTRRRRRAASFSGGEAETAATESSGPVSAAARYAVDVSPYVFAVEALVDQLLAAGEDAGEGVTPVGGVSGRRRSGMHSTLGAFEHHLPFFAVKLVTNVKAVVRDAVEALGGGAGDEAGSPRSLERRRMGSDSGLRVDTAQGAGGRRGPRSAPVVGWPEGSNGWPGPGPEQPQWASPVHAFQSTAAVQALQPPLAWGAPEEGDVGPAEPVSRRMTAGSLSRMSTLADLAVIEEESGESEDQTGASQDWQADATLTRTPVRRPSHVEVTAPSIPVVHIPQPATRPPQDPFPPPQRARSHSVDNISAMPSFSPAAITAVLGSAAGLPGMDAISALHPSLPAFSLPASPLTSAAAAGLLSPLLLGTPRGPNDSSPVAPVINPAALQSYILDSLAGLGATPPDALDERGAAVASAAFEAWMQRFHAGAAALSREALLPARLDAGYAPSPTSPASSLFSSPTGMTPVGGGSRKPSTDPPLSSPATSLGSAGTDASPAAVAPPDPPRQAFADGDGIEVMPADDPGSMLVSEMLSSFHAANAGWGMPVAERHGGPFLSSIPARSDSLEGGSVLRAAAGAAGAFDTPGNTPVGSGRGFSAEHEAGGSRYNSELYTPRSLALEDGDSAAVVPPLKSASSYPELRPAGFLEGEGRFRRYMSLTPKQAAPGVIFHPLQISVSLEDLSSEDDDSFADSADEDFDEDGVGHRRRRGLRESLYTDSEDEGEDDGNVFHSRAWDAAKSKMEERQQARGGVLIEGGGGGFRRSPTSPATPPSPYFPASRPPLEDDTIVAVKRTSVSSIGSDAVSPGPDDADGKDSHRIFEQLARAVAENVPSGPESAPAPPPKQSLPPLPPLPPVTDITASLAPPDPDPSRRSLTSPASDGSADRTSVSDQGTIVRAPDGSRSPSLPSPVAEASPTTPVPTTPAAPTFTSCLLIPVDGSFAETLRLDLFHVNRLGRGRDDLASSGGVFVPFSSLVVSRNHAEIFIEEDVVYIRDLGSKSGTFVNGKRLSPSKLASPCFVLHTGDAIQLGQDFPVEGSGGRRPRSADSDGSKASPEGNPETHRSVKMQAVIMLGTRALQNLSETSLERISIPLEPMASILGPPPPASAHPTNRKRSPFFPTRPSPSPPPLLQVPLDFGPRLDLDAALSSLSAVNYFGPRRPSRDAGIGGGTAAAVADARRGSTGTVGGGSVFVGPGGFTRASLLSSVLSDRETGVGQGTVPRRGSNGLRVDTSVVKRAKPAPPTVSASSHGRDTETQGGVGVAGEARVGGRESPTARAVSPWMPEGMGLRVEYTFVMSMVGSRVKDLEVGMPGWFGKVFEVDMKAWQKKRTLVIKDLRPRTISLNTLRIFPEFANPHRYTVTLDGASAYAASDLPVAPAGPLPPKPIGTLHFDSPLKLLAESRPLKALFPSHKLPPSLAAHTAPDTPSPRHRSFLEELRRDGAAAAVAGSPARSRLSTHPVDPAASPSLSPHIRFSLAGDLRAGRFVVVRKCSSHRRQELVGDAGGKMTVRRSVRETKVACTVSIAEVLEREAPLDLLLVAGLCLVFVGQADAAGR